MTARRSSALILSTALVAGGVVLTAAPAYAATDYPVSNYTELDTAVTTAVDGDTITFLNDITATGDMPAITNDITILGGGFVFDGAVIQRGIEVVGAAVTIEQLTVTDVTPRSPRSGPCLAGL